VVSVGSVLLAGIWWITNRRGEVRRQEGPGDPPPGPGSPTGASKEQP